MTMSESALQQAVIDLARWAGFMYFHDNDPRRNRPGWPDLVLLHARTGRLIFIELKSDKGKVSPEQHVWLRTLDMHHETYTWRPIHWTDGTIRRVLTEGRAVNAA